MKDKDRIRLFAALLHERVFGKVIALLLTVAVVLLALNPVLSHFSG